MFFLGYVILALIVFFINVIPAFMPPTWIVLAFSYLHYHLLLIPTVIVGASFATLGRIVLYYMAKKYFHVFFSQTSKKNFTAIGNYLNKRKHITIPLLIAYAFFPIPSNQVYIAAGLADFDIRVMASCFFIGRLISYTFWVSAAKITVSSLDLIFLKHISKTQTILIDILGFILLYAFSMINWKKLIRKNRK